MYPKVPAMRKLKDTSTCKSSVCNTVSAKASRVLLEPRRGQGTGKVGAEYPGGGEGRAKYPGGGEVYGIKGS
jgi:hypothetical protein